MNTYAAIFSKIVDSSLWDEPDYVVKVFITLLAKKDKDQVVRANAYMIGRWARKTEKETLDALRVLSSPDKKRLEPQEHEGRRVQKVEDGWLVLNGQMYQDLMVEVNRRAGKAKAEAERRIRLKLAQGKPLGGESTYVQREKDGASKAELDKLTDNR